MVFTQNYELAPIAIETRLKRLLILSSRDNKKKELKNRKNYHLESLEKRATNKEKKLQELV